MGDTGDDYRFHKEINKKRKAENLITVYEFCFLLITFPIFAFCPLWVSFAFIGACSVLWWGLVFSYFINRDISKREGER